MTHNVKVAATPAEARSAVAAESKTFSQRLNRGRTDTVAAVGTVEVTGLPQVLHTRNLGGLDLLFIPLLDSARGILSFIDKMCAAGESREQAISMARIRLASEMLQDPSFTLAPRGMDEDNIDGRSNQWLGVLPDAADDHLTQLMEGLAKLAQGS
jgi:hypothetical protein